MLKFGNRRQREDYPTASSPQQRIKSTAPQGGSVQRQAPGKDAGDYRREGGEYGGLPDERALSEYLRERTAEIDRQVEEFSRKNPDFDIRRELRNPQFCTYVWENGLSIEDAYYLTHRQEIEALGMDSRRGGYRGRLGDMNGFGDMSGFEEPRRIAENGASGNRGSGMLKKNPAEMSDEEIDEIAERVRRGEKISF